MTEQDPNTPATPPATPPETPQEPAPAAPKAKAAKVDETPKRYAAYDKTYLRYVGDVCDTRAAAAKQAKDREVKSFEIREV